MPRVILSMLGMLILIVQLHLKKIHHVCLFNVGMLLVKFIQPTSQSKKTTSFSAASSPVIFNYNYSCHDRFKIFSGSDVDMCLHGACTCTCSCVCVCPFIIFSLCTVHVHGMCNCTVASIYCTT